MLPMPEALDLGADVVALTAALVNIESVSRDEVAIADAVEAALRAVKHLDVVRDGHSVVARTTLGRTERVVVAGHLDTVPVNANLPSRLDADHLYGLGSCDMKGGVAVAIAHELKLPIRYVGVGEGIGDLIPFSAEEYVDALFEPTW